jgi:hypothetical protein
MVLLHEIGLRMTEKGKDNKVVKEKALEGQENNLL